MVPNSTRSAAPYAPSADLDANFVNEAHIQAFSEALRDEEPPYHHGDTSPAVPSTPLHPHSTRIRKVTALSDFAPVNLRVKRRRKRDRSQKKQDWLFLFLRWPLLFFIFLFIAGEFGLYVFIRQLVNTKEWISAWRGRKGILRMKLRAASTYDEWREAAQTLDQYLQFNEWKKVDEDPFYDWKLVRKVRRSLRTLREKGDPRGVLGVLETCIRTNFAGVESSRLYSETFIGTKDLIESYHAEQVKAMEYIRDSPALTLDEKKRFFKRANTNLGISALCLSGGASFGYYHFGVVKAFLEADLLPRVITGTSAGGLIAALVCTRTDAELKRLLVPELANRITACEEPFWVWFQRFWKTGARFDSIAWARKCTFFTRGSMTFREAYLRTGRVLNISVIPADRHSPTKLLNYMTSPDTLIWTALLASAAVPGILNPVVLMQKLKDGSIVPWNWGSRFKDGSLRVDIPVQALNQFFNVTNPVVSQVNPHVHLFFFAPRGSAGKPVAHRKGKGWRGNFLLSAGEQWLKHELTKNFKVIRDLELLPQLLGQDWSSVFLQRFDGAVTIWPRTRIWDWFHLLTDPDPPELERMMRVGQLVTWPKLHMIENRAKLEKQILMGRQAVRKQFQNKAGRVRDQEVPLAPKSGAPAVASPTSTPLPTGSDAPLLDTDTEAPITHSCPLLTGDASGSAATPPKDDHPLNGYDPSTVRRRWVSEFIHQQQDKHNKELHDNAANCTGSRLPFSKSPTGSFLSRLRTQSFNAIPSFTPSKTVGHREGSVHGASDHAWSSDSSSDGDSLSVDERRHIRNPSILHLADSELVEDAEAIYKSDSDV